MRVSIALPLLMLAAAPAQAQSDTQPYRALGTEPFWSLTIGTNDIRYQPAQGRARTVARPRPIIGINGERYETRGMIVDITHVRCTDGMSERVFQDTVQLTIDGRTLRGCGGGAARVQADARLDGNWRIATIGGRPALPRTSPTIRFDGNRISGNTGCNSFSGTYRLDRGRLIAGALATTRRACLGPGVSAQERRLASLLGQPLRVGSDRGGKRVITAPNGQSLVLARR